MREFYGTARRSFVAYRLALDEVHWADVSDQIGLSERFLRDHFGNKVSSHEAKRYFSLVPEGIGFPGQPLGLTKIEPTVQMGLNSGSFPEKFSAVPSLKSAPDLSAPPTLPRRNGKLVGIERELVDHFVELAGAMGVPRSYGEIYAVYLLPAPSKRTIIRTFIC